MRGLFKKDDIQMAFKFFGVVSLVALGWILLTVVLVFVVLSAYTGHIYK